MFATGTGDPTLLPVTNLVQIRLGGLLCKRMKYNKIK